MEKTLETPMLKRQHLPLMTKLNMTVDIERLRTEFFNMGLDDFSKYNGLSYDKAAEDGLIVRRVLLEYFLNDEELAAQADKEIAEGGESYKMLCLTEFNGDPEHASRNLKEKLGDVRDPRALARRLEKISDPDHPDYVPIADEKLYDKRNEFCSGYVGEIMDMIEDNIGHVARSRFAVLRAGEQIKPHLDINTDKAVRIHIPVVTHPDVVFGLQGKRRTVEQHMPADGSVYFINQGYKHWVYNNSPIDRVHLMFVVTGQRGITEGKEVYWDE